MTWRREMAKRCCATVPIRAYVEGLLDRLGVPAAGRDPKRLQKLDEIYERSLRPDAADGDPGEHRSP